ncbi:MAG TPA: sigma-70 family RNA polymerase sigma factor [Vicinamibacterales bacterium]|nr:sigma-70 family RNA polymerase sigma factor [Vicinamibacterales bacterium]
MKSRASDRELVARMQAGEERAMADLAATYGPRIHQLALRYTKNYEDAEEVAQDVLLKVSRKIGAFRGDAALSSWIYRITFNTAMSRLRRDRARRQEPVEPPPLSPEHEARRPEPADASLLADDEMLRAELRRRLIEALRELPLVYRAPVLLRDVHGLSTEEAAAVLRIKPQTLKSRLHRGRLQLRARLAEFAGGLSFRRH